MIIIQPQFIVPLPVETPRVSWPSGPVNFCMIPSPAGLTTKFVYNFYTQDESVNEGGYSLPTSTSSGNNVDLLSDGDGAIAEGPDKLLQTQLLKFNVPRYISINFLKPNILQASSYNKTDNDVTPEDAEDNESMIRQHMGNILDDSSIGTTPSNKFVSISLQSNDLALSFANEFQSLSTYYANQPQKYQELLEGTGDTDYVYNADTPAGIEIPSSGIELSYGMIAKQAISELQSMDSYLSEDDVIRSGDSVFHDLSSVNMYTQINGRFVGDIMLAGASTSNSPFPHAMARDLRTSFSIEENARTAFSGFTGYHDYEIDIDIEELANQRGRVFNVEQVPSNLTEPPEIKHIGYICEKFEKLPTGERIRKETLVFGNPNTTSGIDTRIRCGARYEYAVRTIAIFKHLISAPDAGGRYRVSYLWSSPPSATQAFLTDPSDPTVTSAPGHPEEVNFYWDYSSDVLNITWSFPITQERDIKYFQIFRREKLWEPFQLIREYDFNDALIPWPRDEYIRPSLIEKLKYSKTLFTDLEFKKDSMFVYSIVAIDAHGKSSNYSQQFVVWFDIYENSLKVRLASASGAPKAYPNLYLEKFASFTGENVSITEDLIKVSKPKDIASFSPLKNSFSVLFDPGEIELYKGQENLKNVVFNSVGLGSEEKELGPQYLMQITNLDLQKSKLIPIKIHDFRG